MSILSPLGEAALAAAEIGWPVFPCVPRGKRPLAAAAPHGLKDATTDPRRLCAWWTRWPDANLAVACGAPGPDVLDIDTKGGRSGRDLFQRAWRAGLLRGWTAQVVTPSGGRHFWYAGTDQRGGAVGRDKALELKATGGYVLLPPSFVEDPDHGYAGRYEVAEFRDDDAVVDFAAVKLLLDPAPVRLRQVVTRPHDGSDRPGDVFNRTTDWAEILAPHGWTFAYQTGTVSYWRRPGKTLGISASTNALGTDRLRVFTTSTDFEAESYSKFGAYAVLNFGGDQGAAARELRKLGYGQRVAA